MSLKYFLLFLGGRMFQRSAMMRIKQGLQKEEVLRSGIFFHRLFWSRK
jgi:hypothetical protein